MRNEYKIIDNYVIINLNNNKKECYKCFVDLADLEKLLKFDVTWYPFYDTSNKSYYARCTAYLGMFDGKAKYKLTYMHKFIFNLETNNLRIDHINYDTLDNRGTNIRITDHKHNTMSRKGKNSNNKSGHRNVSWNKGSKKWIVQLQLNGVNTVLGKFNNLDEAGKFAEEKRKEIYGEWAGGN